MNKQCSMWNNLSPDEKSRLTDRKARDIVSPKIMNAKEAISDYYDPSGQITEDSDPVAEFETYQKQCARNPEFRELDLTEQDFRDYIESLKD